MCLLCLLNIIFIYFISFKYLFEYFYNVFFNFYNYKKKEVNYIFLLILRDTIGFGNKFAVSVHQKFPNHHIS